MTKAAISKDNGDRFKPVPIIKVYSATWARQGQAWGDESSADRMVEEMWAKYRKTLKAPTDGWESNKKCNGATVN